ncbi:hypothetical protein ABZ942_18470 [Nocardia sp. NPDC046473]|uniref:hypothetical protein n=1 Tax=Nocardia sp. NPDC046473 TaxID=3155733 RepID=UPI0033C96FCA
MADRAFADAAVVIVAADVLAPAGVSVDPNDHPESVGILDMIVIDQPAARCATLCPMG